MRIRSPKCMIAGVTFFRQYQPMVWLAQEPYNHEVIMFNDSILEDVLSEDFDIYFTASAAKDGQLELIKLLKEYGRKVIIDYDDSEDCHPANPMYVMSGTEECTVTLPDGRKIIWEDKKTVVNVFGNDVVFDLERNKADRNVMDEIKREATALTTTTERLRKELLKYNPNVYVMPNVIDPTLYTPKANDNPDEVRVGWVISSSHLDDIVSWKPEILKCLDENPTMKMVIMVFGLTNEFDDLIAEYPNRVELIPGVNIDRGYHKVFSELKLDIGICHLEDTEFNWMKSPVKWAEYSAMGIPTVASHVMYGDHLTDRSNVYIYRNAKEFRHNIKYLINRPELRKKVGQKAKEDAQIMFGADTIYPLYDKMFKLIGGNTNEKNTNTDSTDATDIN